MKKPTIEFIKGLEHCEYLGSGISRAAFRDGDVVYKISVDDLDMEEKNALEKVFHRKSIYKSVHQYEGGQNYEEYKVAQKFRHLPFVPEIDFIYENNDAFIKTKYYGKTLCKLGWNQIEGCTVDGVFLSPHLIDELYEEFHGIIDDIHDDNVVFSKEHGIKVIDLGL